MNTEEMMLNIIQEMDNPDGNDIEDLDNDCIQLDNGSMVYFGDLFPVDLRYSRFVLLAKEYDYDFSEYLDYYYIGDKSISRLEELDFDDFANHYTREPLEDIDESLVKNGAYKVYYENGILEKKRKL